MIHNPHFKVVEFDHFRMQAGLPSFVMSVSEWIEKTNAIGIIVKKGRYGGTYAFKDIAFEFGTAISVTFKLYLIDEFQRLKDIPMPSRAILYQKKSLRHKLVSFTQKRLMCLTWLCSE